jgi:hypothetical protein
LLDFSSATEEDSVMGNEPSITPIKPETKDGLDVVVSKYYQLMKQGKGAGTPEGDAALKELQDYVDGNLRYDELAATWIGKIRPSSAAGTVANFSGSVGEGTGIAGGSIFFPTAGVEPVNFALTFDMTAMTVSLAETFTFKSGQVQTGQLSDKIAPRGTGTLTVPWPGAIAVTVPVYVGDSKDVLTSGAVQFEQQVLTGSPQQGQPASITLVCAAGFVFPGTLTPAIA